MAHEHNIVDTDNAFTIDPSSRMISKVSDAKTSIMQYDHNSERLTFTIPQFVEGHDMLLSDKIEIHFTNMGTGTSASVRKSNSDIYRVKDAKVESDMSGTISFSWLVGEASTQLAGTLTFLIKFICYGDPGEPDTAYKWHTHPCTYISILGGMDNSGQVVELHSDVIRELEKRMDEMANNEEIDKRFRTIEDQIADLMYKPIAINSFTNNVHTVEIGSTVTDVTLSWKLNKNAASASVGDTTVDTIQNGSLTLTDLKLTSNKTWTLKVADEREASASKSTSVTFLNGVYYGAAPAGTIDSNFVKSLTRTLRSNKLPSFTLTTGANQYMWYCLPTRYGTCTFMNNNVTGGFFLADTIDFTNASGYKENYYIYRSDYPNLGTKTMTVS